jgi:hypothetical protein
MPGFLDKIKSSADKAAFEADRLVRVNQAQAAVRSAQRDLEGETLALGRETLALYDAGALNQPELQALCEKIDGQRQQLATLEAAVERIRQEKAPDASQAAVAEPPVETLPASPVPPPAPAATPVSQAAAPTPQSRTCPNCGSPLRAGIRFCPECGTRVEQA